MTDRNEPAEAGTASYLRRSSELLWGSPARPARGPKPGLTSRERVAVIVALDSYVTGSVRQEILYAAAPAETGISDEEFWSHQYPFLERAIETGNYPAVASLDEDAFSDSWQDTFEFGLVRLLDGLAQLIESRSGDREPVDGQHGPQAGGVR